MNYDIIAMIPAMTDEQYDVFCFWVTIITIGLLFVIYILIFVFICKLIKKIK